RLRRSESEGRQGQSEPQRRRPLWQRTARAVGRVSGQHVTGVASDGDRVRDSGDAASLSEMEREQLAKRAAHGPITQPTTSIALRVNRSWLFFGKVARTPWSRVTRRLGPQLVEDKSTQCECFEQC